MMEFGVTYIADKNFADVLWGVGRKSSFLQQEDCHRTPPVIPFRPDYCYCDW